MKGFLETYRILDLTTEVGVYATRILADLGADVIKVEPPEGDSMRNYPPFIHDEPHPEKSLHFLVYNLNKRSITLNLESTEGRNILKELVKRADAIVESFTPGYLKSLQLDYDTLRQVNPKVVMASITHFGQTGPWKDYKSSDLIDQALGGLVQRTGEPSQPVQFGPNHAYTAGSLYGALGVAAALYGRHASGQGQYVDVSVQEATTLMTTEVGQALTWFILKENPTRLGLVYQSSFPAGCIKVKDGYIYTGIMTEGEWERWAQWIYEVSGNEEWLDPMYKGPAYVRAQYKDYLDPMIEEQFFSRLTKEELFRQGQEKRRLVIFPVVSMKEVCEDPQLNARGFFVEVETVEGVKVRVPKLPYHSSELPWQVYRVAPRLGEHNREIYCGELGFSHQDLLTLKASGVI